MKIVIVGGDSGGLEVAKQIRKKNKTDEIVILEKLKYISYEKAAMPLFIGGKVEKGEDLIIEDFETIKNNYNLDIKLGAEVVKIHPGAHEVEVLETESGTMFKISYDKLVIATGTNAIKLDELNSLGDNVFIHKNLKNAKRLKQYIERFNPKTALVVGGGTISLPLTESLNTLGMEVYLMEKHDTILPQFDNDMALEAEEILSEYVHIIKNARILKSKQIDETLVEVEYTEEGKKYKKRFDIIIVTAGVVPVSDFAKKAGIKVDDREYIIVDKEMKTNIADIYAIGDVAKVESNYEGIYVTPNVAPSSKRQARVAAHNILGITKKYPGSTNTMLVAAYGYYMAKTGLGEKKLDKFSIPYFTKILLGKSSSTKIKGSEDLLIKCIFEEKTKVLLGAFVISKKSADKKIDILATAVRTKMTAEDLAMLELSYTPKSNEIIDIINLIGEEASE